MAKFEELKINQLVTITSDVIDASDQANLKGKTGMIYVLNEAEQIAEIKIDRRTPLPFALDEFEVKE